jgi:CDP-diglyceride synthetase
MLKLSKDTALFVTVFLFVLFFFHVLRLYLNVNYQKDYEFITFIPLFIVLCFGIISGLSHFNFRSSFKKNFNKFFVSILILTTLITLLFCVRDIQLGRFSVIDSIQGGIFSGFEIVFIFFIGYITGRVGGWLSRRN